MRCSYQITLRAARQSCGYTVREVAEALGVSERTVQRYERDSSNLRLLTVIKLADLYPIPLDLIYFGPETECFKHNRTFSEERRAKRAS